MYGFMAGALVVLLLVTGLPACAPAAEEEAPPVAGETAYEKYVSSLPEGCFPVPQDCFDQAIEEGQLNAWNWAEWFPESYYSDFEKEFGIKVVFDSFADYEEMTAKFKLNPNVAYDVVLPGTRAMAQLIDMGIWQELNHDWLPNVNAYQTKDMESVWVEEFGSEGFRYGVPLDMGFTAYTYNKKYIDDSRMPSWSVLLEPKEEYWGRFTMLNSVFDCVGSALQYLGYSLNSDNESELMEAKALLFEQKPKVMAWDSVPRRAMLEEETWMAQGWTGDAWWWHLDDPNIVCALPTEGTRVATDGYAIPMGSTHPAAAHLFLNYAMRPYVEGALVEEIGFAPVHSTAAEYVSNEELSNWPGMTWPEGYLTKCSVIKPSAYELGSVGETLRTQIWEELKT